MKCPSQTPDQGSFCTHFHEFSLDDGRVSIATGYRADEPSDPRLLLNTSKSSCRGLGCQPLPSGPSVWRFLVDRPHYLGNILPGSSKMAYDPSNGTRERASSLSIYHDLAGHECSGTYLSSEYESHTW